MRNYFSGTSNLVLPVKNKSFFPPEFQRGTRLTYYASLFNSVEINASFYRMPRAQTIGKWSAEVPEDFAFTFKLHQSVTHALKGQFDLQPVPAFMEAIGATVKRGCLLIQLPPKFGSDLLALHQLLAALRPYQWPLAIEFRHTGWYQPKVYDLLGEFGAAMVLHDMRRSASPMTITSQKHVFVRFHGPEDGYRGSYSDAHLAEYAGYIREWLAEDKKVYCYFNNTLGAAVQNLQTLNHYVQNGD